MGAEVVAPGSRSARSGLVQPALALLTFDFFDGIGVGRALYLWCRIRSVAVVVAVGLGAAFAHKRIIAPWWSLR